ncbi:hypothetical protein [uncultured Parabacteroides sp.]|uniref:hypothetical protein n=1 Tax=uncultured Parabacteroides sp. TaxID=512312 RepID=UPI0026212D70|nr:hypothetical protein [uncultured Parabacteroides sp.]
MTMSKLNEHHLSDIEAKKRSIASWQRQPLSLERLIQFKCLREQRIARESKLGLSDNLL